ncbi:hypothetical protein LINPERHAP1_LOCUS21276 [Linum perenne]
MNREGINLINPRVLLLLRVNRPESFPNSTVTLETRPESNLPRAVPSPNPSLGLAVGQLIPQRAARRVSEPV